MDLIMAIVLVIYLKTQELEFGIASPLAKWVVWNELSSRH
jgi:hypothetical protein